MSAGSRRAQVDLLLKFRGTPRGRLFEYPYRDDDSRRYIAEAEAALDRILELQATAIREAQAEAWEEGVQSWYAASKPTNPYRRSNDE